MRGGGTAVKSGRTTEEQSTVNTLRHIRTDGQQRQLSVQYLLSILDNSAIFDTTVSDTLFEWTD